MENSRTREERNGYWIKIYWEKISNEIIINKENTFILFITIKYILNMEMIYRGFIIL